MGRKPTKNLNLPSGLHARRQRSGTVYYYYDLRNTPRRWIALGADYALAVKKWAELEMDAKPRHAQIITFRYVAERYLREIVPAKASRTQKDNLLQLQFLYMFFDNPPAQLDQIKPKHIRQYLDWRGKASKTQANREKALFSHIWNKAREWGYTALTNPCAGIKGFRERARKTYVFDEDFQRVYEGASQPLRDFMDLLYLTGQRPADVLTFTRHDIKDGVLLIQQEKTETPIRMSVKGELKRVIDRITSRKVMSIRLVVSETGQPLTLRGMEARFRKAAKAVGSTFQLRDLRAKAGTDKAESSGDIRKAQKQLGHSTVAMTEDYIRARGERVDPTK